MNYFLILLLPISLSVSLFPAAATEPSGAAESTYKKSYNYYSWDYWSYELGLGAGLACTKKPISWNSDVYHEPTENVKKTAAEEWSVQQWPDFRLSIERSWHFAERWTATCDWALCTPAFTLGYLVSPRMRIYGGVQLPLLLNSLSMVRWLCVGPRIGADVFLSSRTMLRANLSYDYIPDFMHFETGCSIGNLHWPQLTVSLKRFF